MPRRQASLVVNHVHRGPSATLLTVQHVCRVAKADSLPTWVQACARNVLQASFRVPRDRARAPSVMALRGLCRGHPPVSRVCSVDPETIRMVAVQMISNLALVTVVLRANSPTMPTAT